MTIRWHALEPGFTVEELPAQDYPVEIERRVAALWATQLAARGPSLFDGPTFTLDELRRDRLRLRPSSYRYTLARRLDPGLVDAVRLRPLAVSGMLFCRDGLVLGRRAAQVTLPGLWETAPAGSLAMPDPTVQLLAEVTEELGLPASLIDVPRVLGMVEEAEAGTFDIIYRLATPLTAREIEAHHRASGTPEYDRIAIIAPEKLAGFLDDPQNQLVSILRPLLGWTGVLPAP